MATLSAKMLNVPREELIGDELRERRKLRWAGGIAAALLMLLAGVAMWLGQRADERRRAASSRQAAVQASSVPRADEALLLGVAAHSIADTAEARSALLDRLQRSSRLRRVLHGHTADVMSVAVFDDGTCASGDERGVILLHRYGDGRLLGELRGHESKIRALAALPKAHALLSADEADRLLFWDLRTRTAAEPAGWFDGIERRPVDALAVTADEGLVAAGHEGGAVSILDVAAKRLLRRFEVSHREIMSVAWMGRRALVVGTTAGHVLLVNAETGAVEKRWKIGSADVALVGVAPDGTVFALDQAKRLGNWGDGEWSRDVEHDVLSAGYDPVRDVIAAADHDGAVHLYSRETGGTVAPPLTGHASAVPSAAFSRDGRFLVSGSFDHTVMSWDLLQFHPIVAARYGFAMRPVPRILPDGSIGGFTESAEKMERWRITSGGRRQTTVVSAGTPLHTLAVSNDGTRAAWIAPQPAADEIRFYDGSKTRRLAAPGARIRRLAMSERGTYVAAALPDQRVALWDADRHRWSTLPGSRFLSVFAFSKDERLLAAGDGDGGVRLFDTATGKLLADRPRLHGGTVMSIAFDDTGSRIATGGGGGNRDVILLDLPALDDPRHLRGLHRRWVRALTFGADLLASAADDGTIVLWNVRTLQPMGTITVTAPGLFLHDLRFMAGGAALLSNDERGVLVWNIEPESWKKIACAEANRELTEPEWRTRIADEEYRAVCSP